MNAKTQSEDRLVTMGQTMAHNPVYRAAFGVEPDYARGWNKSQLFLKRATVRPDPTVMATGFLGAYQGFHFKRIVIDDPSDQDDVRSPVVMDAQRERLRGVLKDRVEAGGSIDAIFTRWGESDLLATFIDMGFRVVQMPIMAEYPWGRRSATHDSRLSAWPSSSRNRATCCSTSRICATRQPSAGSSSSGITCAIGTPPRCPACRCRSSSP